MDGEQSRCTECGTVLRDTIGGHECHACGLTYLATCSEHEPPYERVAIANPWSFPHLWRVPTSE